MSEVNYVLLGETKGSKLDKLFKVYAESPEKARVLYYNDSNISSFSSSRLVIFERGDNFEICRKTKKFGISITNKMYSSEKTESSVIYKSGKFYYKYNKQFTQLTYSNLCLFAQAWNYSENSADSPSIKYILNKFSWIRFIIENPRLHSIAFNTFTRYKLYNLNDALRHIFKAPLPAVKTYLATPAFQNIGNRELLKNFNETKKNLINIENLRAEMCNHPFFFDTLKMGKMLSKKINCSWSIKRLISEHDKWSHEVADILAEFEELAYLNISKIYLDFAEFANLVPLKTNYELLKEGSIQHHCVGTYSDSVNRGGCCIFHIKGFTLELRFGSRWDFKTGESMPPQLYISQFRGLRNVNAPEELMSSIQKRVDKFNEMGLTEYIKPEEIDCFADAQGPLVEGPFVDFF
jgi:hypothetical protein